jgi:signal transduction histidine kinase
LTTIASSAELLEVYRHQWEDSKQLKHFQRIQATVKHMTALVNDVMFINKAEFEQLEFNPAPLNLATLFQELVDELRLKISDKHSLNFINIGDCKPFYLDAQVLRQIFTNLVSNAIKYSPDGGKVSLQLTGDNNHVIFSCADEGIGIPKEDLNNLFDSFSRASNVGTIAGTGLGLSIVKKCVDLHGGQLSVESEVGVGTKFTVMLPLNPPV